MASDAPVNKLFDSGRDILKDRWASEVACPMSNRLDGLMRGSSGIACAGILRWSDSSRRQLMCTQCGTVFNVFTNHESKKR